MAINPHSAEWKAVERWARERREQAVTHLIANNQSDKQRGVIAALDELLKLAEPQKAKTSTSVIEY